MMTPTEIRNLRKRLGLSQKAFSGAVGTHYVTVARWETGKQAPIKVFIVAMQRLADAHEKTRQV